MAEIKDSRPGESAAKDNRGPVLLRGKGRMATRADISVKSTEASHQDFAEIKEAVDQKASATKPSAGTIATSEEDTAPPPEPTKKDSGNGQVVQDAGGRNVIWRPGK